jgi:hypothetical protein
LPKLGRSIDVMIAKGMKVKVDAPTLFRRAFAFMPISTGMLMLCLALETRLEQMFLHSFIEFSR